MSNTAIIETEATLSHNQREALTDAARINQGGNARASWRVSAWYSKKERFSGSGQLSPTRRT